MLFSSSFKAASSPRQGHAFTHFSVIRGPITEGEMSEGRWGFTQPEPAFHSSSVCFFRNDDPVTAFLFGAIESGISGSQKSFNGVSMNGIGGNTQRQSDLRM